MATGIDHLSVLPMSIITVILSLLPSKDAVKTSILSRSWRYLWKSSSNIEINQENFSSIHACLNFAHNWLTQHPEPTIDRFSITLTTHNVDIHLLLQDLVNFALTRQTKTLELDLPYPTFTLPEAIYNYNQLNHLKLFNCNFSLQDFVNIPLLKTASFGRMTLTNDSLEGFLTRCPLLESLSLVECGGVQDLNVISPSMRSLVVELCYTSRLMGHAPELRRIKYEGNLIEFAFDNDLTLLEEVELDLTSSPDYLEDSGNLLKDLFLRLKHASVLTVCNFITKVLAASAHTWQLPENIEVKNLILSSTLDQYEFIGIVSFLRSAPKLTKIQLEVVPDDEFVSDEENILDELDMETFWGDDMIEEVGVPECIKTCLKEVVINNYTGGENEVRFLQFLFRFGLVLTSVRVRVERDYFGVWRHLIPEITKDLRMWSNAASSCCEIDIMVELISNVNEDDELVL